MASLKSTVAALSLILTISAPSASAQKMVESSWVELVDYACFGARSGQAATITLPNDIKAEKFRFHHLSGTVQCAGHDLAPSYWGCSENVLGLIVTPEGDKSQEIIPWTGAPDYTKHDPWPHANWYRIAGLKVAVKEDLVLHADPDATIKAGKYHVWYAEDLADISLGDNSGTSCFSMSYLPVEGSITTTTATTTTYIGEYNNEFFASVAEDIAQLKKDIMAINNALTRIEDDRTLDLDTVGQLSIRMALAEDYILTVNDTAIAAQQGLDDLASTFQAADEKNKESNALLTKIKDALASGITNTAFMTRGDSCTSGSCDPVVASSNSGDLELLSTNVQMKTKTCGDLNMCDMASILTDIAKSLQDLDKLE